MVYVKSSLTKEIKHLEAINIKTGMLGMSGNKGSCIIRFTMFKTSFAFSNGHYASGEEMNDERIKELTEILHKNLRENIIMSSTSKELRLLDHEVAFVFGDLNFRVDVENLKCRSLIKSGNLEKLLSHDQFLNERKRNSNFSKLEEGPITFEPAFKFDFRSKDYDTSKKKRVASWTDRILWKKSDLIKQVEYNSIPNLMLSDHRPVYGIFKIAVNRGEVINNNSDSEKTKERIKKNLDVYTDKKKPSQHDKKNDERIYKSKSPNLDKMSINDQAIFNKNQLNKFSISDLIKPENQQSDGYIGEVNDIISGIYIYLTYLFIYNINNKLDDLIDFGGGKSNDLLNFGGGENKQTNDLLNFEPQKHNQGNDLMQFNNNNNSNNNRNNMNNMNNMNRNNMMSMNNNISNNFMINNQGNHGYQNPIKMQNNITIINSGQNVNNQYSNMNNMNNMGNNMSNNMNSNINNMNNMNRNMNNNYNNNNNQLNVNTNKNTSNQRSLSNPNHINNVNDTNKSNKNTNNTGTTTQNLMNKMEQEIYSFFK